MRLLSATLGVCFLGRVGGRGLPAPPPNFTPQVSLSGLEAINRDVPDAVSFANVLLTAVPQSLRQLAATNLPAVSSILWGEFLDDHKPDWFLKLPTDIQKYLISEFEPKSAMATLAPSAGRSIPSVPARTTESARSSAVRSSSPRISKPSSGIRSLDPTRLFTSTVTVPMGPSPTSRVGPSSSGTGGLSKSHKIGIGIGISLAIIGAIALSSGCYLLLRWRRQNRANGSVPPSSPGFIPRFAFQEKSNDRLNEECPLYHEANSSTHETGSMDWYRMSHAKDQPILAPTIYHTHSSNRARGKRTNYTSLHSVAEVSELDEVDSPVNSRHDSARCLPLALFTSPTPIGAQIRRKPIPSWNCGISNESSACDHRNSHASAIEIASRNSLPQTTLQSWQTYSSQLPHFGNHAVVNLRFSPRFSPSEDNKTLNPFSNEYSYVEDYGPEYSNPYPGLEDVVYRYTDLSQHPQYRSPTSRRKPQ